MKFTHQNIRNDAPAAPDEIELHPGTLAQAPRRIPHCESSKCLREVSVAEKKLAAEIAEKQAVLAAERARAAEIQDGWEALLAERATLAENIRRAGQELDAARSRMAILDAHVRGNWHSTPLQDLIEEWGRHDFMAQRLPKYIAEWQAAIPEVEARIAAYREQHGIGK